VFGDKILRRISGYKIEEAAGYWRKLHIEELYNCTLNQILFERSNQE
jgi:hypothetical protein